jgi:hypothetical protein
MSALRAFSAALPFAVVAVSCGPEPVGVDACRSIEGARCEVAAACGIKTSVDECKRFYRDQCLHGLALKEAPARPVIEECVLAIRTAGACAKDNAEMSLADCPDAPTAAPGTTLGDVCDVVLTPEKAAPCSFLQPLPEVDAGADTGADTGSGGSNDAATDADTDGGG